ncbi:MAG: ribose ABC transporter permease [Actinobacteria bacterium]|nr:ribose ABC transporter permease [Actinomycetota bacterium]
MIGLLAIIIVVSIIEPNFFAINNFLNILRQSSAIGLCALGMTYVMIAGGFDLSIGSTVSLTGVVAIMIMNSYGVTGNVDVAAVIAILAAIIVGAIVGFINGIILAAINGRLGEAFIITYSMQIVIAAIALIVSGGQFIFGRFEEERLYTKIGTDYGPILIFIVIAILMQLIFANTNFGRQSYFLGGNMDVAKMAGIKIKQIRVINFIVCGICAGLAGIIVTSRVYSASPLQGSGYELNAIAAVVIGGTSLMGGSGSILKTILGVLILGILSNALNVIGVNAYAQLIVRGAIIITAVALDGLKRSAEVRGLVTT